LVENGNGGKYGAGMTPQTLKKVATASVLMALALSAGMSMCGEPAECAPESEIRNTMKNLLRYATAAEGYRIDYGAYPVVNSIRELFSVIEGAYVSPRHLSTHDAWGSEFLVSSDGRDFEIRSVGSDGEPDREVHGGAARLLESDIVVRNGIFIQCPREYCGVCPSDFCDKIGSEFETNKGAS
jgi:hypothetical protein